MSRTEAEAGGALAPSRRALVAVSAALAASGASACEGTGGRALEAALMEAARSAVPKEVEEALLQSYLFLGYPAALNGLACWRRVSGRPAASPLGEDPTGWSERGEEVCRRVYGGQYEGLRRNVQALHPDLERWMVMEGYGKVLGRPGLPLVARELCVVALLTVLDAPTQLYSHLRGALNAGASEAEVEEALGIGLGLAREEARADARRTWERVRSRGGGLASESDRGDP